MLNSKLVLLVILLIALNGVFVHAMEEGDQDATMEEKYNQSKLPLCSQIRTKKIQTIQSERCNHCLRKNLRKISHMTVGACWIEEKKNKERKLFQKYAFNAELKSQSKKEEHCSPMESPDRVIFFQMCYQNNIKEVQKLCDKKPYLINMKNKLGERPIHIATHFSLPTLLEFLVAKRALLNVVDNNGDTPLHRAAINGNYAAIQVLIRFGANFHVTNKLNQTPYNIACLHQRTDIVVFLTSYNAIVGRSSSKMSQQYQNWCTYVQRRSTPYNRNVIIPYPYFEAIMQERYAESCDIACSPTQLNKNKHLSLMSSERKTKK